MAVFLTARKIWHWTTGCLNQGAGTDMAVTARILGVSLSGYGTRLTARLEQNLFYGLNGCAYAANANSYLCQLSGGPRCATTRTVAFSSLRHSARTAATAAGIGPWELTTLLRRWLVSRIQCARAGAGLVGP